MGALGGAIDAGLGAVTGGFGGLAVEGFGGIVKALFAWPAKLVNRELLAWLVAVPDYAIPASSGPAGRRGGELAELAGTTQTMAFAALGAVGTVAGVRYWAAGLTGSGGVEALEGLARTVAAALAIVAWPWLFRHGADLANAAGRGLLGSERVLEDTARMLASAFAAAVAFNVLAILVALAAAVLLLMLLVAKIAVSAGTALVFVGMPLALLLWPLPELAWVARAALRMFGIVLAIPLAWAVSFATFAAVGVDALSFDGAGGVGDKLLTPSGRAGAAVADRHAAALARARGHVRRRIGERHRVAHDQPGRGTPDRRRARLRHPAERVRGGPAGPGRHGRRVVGGR